MSVKIIVKKSALRQMQQAKAREKIVQKLQAQDQPNYNLVLDYCYLCRDFSHYIVGGEAVAYKVNCNGKTYLLKAINKCNHPSKSIKQNFSRYCAELQDVAAKTQRVPQVYAYKSVAGITKDHENLLILQQFIPGRHLYYKAGTFDKKALTALGYTSYAGLDYKTADSVRVKELELCLQDYIAQNNTLANLSGGELARFLNAIRYIYKNGIYSKLDLIDTNIMIDNDKLYLIDPFFAENPSDRSSAEYRDISLDEHTIIGALSMLSPNNIIPNIVLKKLADFKMAGISNEQLNKLEYLTEQFCNSVVLATTKVLQQTLLLVDDKTKKGPLFKSKLLDGISKNVVGNKKEAAEQVMDGLEPTM